MAGYVKRIALIKTEKRGFSSDGGELSGLIKCEVYAGFLKVEASLVNFSPLTEGRYEIGVSDGRTVLSFGGTSFEAQTDFDLSRGFAAVVCFCHGTVTPVASAVCGDFTGELAKIVRAMNQTEGVQPVADSRTAFDDEAIAEENYYELEADEGGGAVCEDAPQEKDGGTGGKDEAPFSPVEEEPVTASGDDTDGDIPQPFVFRETIAAQPKLAEGDFYGRMKGEIDKIFAAYPVEEGLERVIEGSRWVRISYGQGKFYAFGVIFDDDGARYICYGVPSVDASRPPRSLAGRASYIPVEGFGFWVMYQDARTGVSIKITRA